MNNIPVNVLLADNDAADRRVLKNAFEDLQMKTIVHTVNDGAQLMNYLGKKDVALPTLVLTGLNLPSKNGLECVKEIRSNNALDDISIAVYAASEHDYDIKEAFLRGANVYIKKPADFKSLKQALQRMLLAVVNNELSASDKSNFMMRI
jgi:CheY-like chemotaxis protein